MTPFSEPFTLRTTLTSPFGRKVRIAADLLGLAERLRIEPASTMDAHDTLRTQNPLGRIPCLLAADGEAIHDSWVIVELLQDIAGADRPIPKSGAARYRALTRATLADGITEAALLMIYDSRFRPGAPPSEQWLAHLRGKIERALAAFDAEPPDRERLDIAGIGLVCALGYLDWRKPVDWRGPYPALAEWLDTITANEPSIGRCPIVVSDQELSANGRAASSGR